MGISLDAPLALLLLISGSMNVDVETGITWAARHTRESEGTSSGMIA